MRKAVLGVMLGSLIAAPANAQSKRFAISCSGTTVASVQRPGGTAESRTSKMRGIIYVIDEDARTVDRLMPRATGWEEVCMVDDGCTREFSAARITISADLTRTSTGERTTTFRRISLFDWDRATNRLETKFDLIGTTTMTVLLHGSFKCAPAKIPAGYVPRTGTT